MYQQLVKSTDTGGKRPDRSASKDSLASDLSSPIESSANDSDSPLDTTGSIADLSDSNYNASESDTSEAMRQPTSWATCNSRTSGLIGAAKSLLPGNNGGNFNAGLELSPMSELTSTSYSAVTPLPRRYPLHSIKEESDEHDHNVTLPVSNKTPVGKISSTRQFPQTKTDESLSILSREGGGSVDSVEMIEGSSRGHHLPPTQSSTSSTSTSGHLLAAMFRQGKIKTGGFPSWFPKREGLI